MADTIRYVDRLIVEAIHFDLLSTHGGMRGLRDEGALESAIARPRQKAAYEESVDVAALAAAYAFGLARNHPFNDGNKRIAFVVAAVFLELNGLRFQAPEPDAAKKMLALAAGELTEDELAAWIRANSQ
jgi:death-on-curing protein